MLIDFFLDKGGDEELGLPHPAGGHRVPLGINLNLHLQVELPGLVVAGKKPAGAEPVNRV
jgi:hypothetical protein